jgi:hypothetical protein
VATVEGGIYTARSRHGVANELARQLVAAGDLPPPFPEIEGERHQ